MAWDSKSARKRGHSNATSTKVSSAEVHTASYEVTAPKSTHCADSTLQPFLSPDFDAAAFLNATLPPLSQEIPLAELSTQTQTLLSQLSAHTTRLTNTLTQLTDEILRSGSRLAYEVEVLRGETLGLAETLSEGLSDDISGFVPGGLGTQLARRTSHSVTGSRRRSLAANGEVTSEDNDVQTEKDPEFISQLRTLSQVRTRLESVIKTFGDAMSWTFPPSEVSVTSSFISVSAPEPGSEAYSVEEKGQQMSLQLRSEIADLLIGQDPLDGIEAAARRVEELKDLATVWKGTAEEKARAKFVENLAKLVEEKHKDLLREAINSRSSGETSRNDAFRDSNDQKIQSSYGFMSQLQKMRGGL